MAPRLSREGAEGNIDGCCCSWRGITTDEVLSASRVLKIGF